jgi:hypothetical protein
MEACIYCGATITERADVEPPHAQDHAAWAALVREHQEGCEWALTRAHRLDEQGLDDLRRAVRVGGVL